MGIPSHDEVSALILKEWEMINANVDAPDRDFGGYVNAKNRVICEYQRRYPNFVFEESKLQLSRGGK